MRSCCTNQEIEDVRGVTVTNTFNFRLGAYCVLRNGGISECYTMYCTTQGTFRNGGILECYTMYCTTQGAFRNGGILECYTMYCTTQGAFRNRGVSECYTMDRTTQGAFRNGVNVYVCTFGVVGYCESENVTRVLENRTKDCEFSALLPATAVILPLHKNAFQ